jgi:hypothetical protein
LNNNGTIMSGVGMGSLPLANWTVAQTGDFDGDRGGAVADEWWNNHVRAGRRLTAH